MNAKRTKNAPKTDRPTAVRPFLDLAIVVTATWNMWKEDSSSEKKIKLDNKTLQLVSDGGSWRQTSNKVYARDGSFLIPLLSDLLSALYLSLYQYHTITKNKRLSVPYLLQVTSDELQNMFFIWFAPKNRLKKSYIKKLNKICTSIKLIVEFNDWK